MKKILCISDQIDPVIYSKDIKEKYGDVDFIISAGDLPIDYLDFVQNSLNKPLYFVFGSHHLKALTHYHPEMAEKTKDGEVNIFKKGNTKKSNQGIYIGFKSLKYENMIIAGVSGAKKHNDGKNQFTEKQMKRKLSKMIPALFFNKIKYGRYLDILVTHCPPLIEGEKEENKQEAFECFTKFINFFKPKYLIHGQVHIYDPQQCRSIRHGATEIINAYSRHILEIT